MSMLSSSLSSSTTSLHFNHHNLAGNLSPPPSFVKFRRHLAVETTACTANSSLYDVLGISITASDEEIKAAYRRLARSCHPDVAFAAGERRSDGGDFIRIHDAYSTLSDPKKRADYDRRLFQMSNSISTVRPFPGLSASTDSTSFCGYPRRNWETDQCW